MADLGEWGTLSLELPDFLKDVREAVNSIAEFLLTFLDIALAALQIIKAFAIGFLDPIAALVQAIIDQINSLLRDLKELGIYITGDWALLDHPYADLRGGYSEYERRMIARLTDRTDPTRPDISANADVFAAFFYVSVDSTGINRLVHFIKQLLDLFNQSFNPSGTPPVPIVTGIKFGNQANGDVFDSFENLTRFEDTPPEKMLITWKAQPTTQKNAFSPFPPVGPQGFLVTVGVREEGIPLAFNRPENDAKKREPEGGDSGRRPRREAGNVLNREGQPVILYGGDQMVVGPDSVAWNDAVEGPNHFKDGATAVYGLKSRASGEVIDLNQLTDGPDYLLQRTFAVEADQLSAWVNNEYSIVINFDDLPLDAEFKLDSATGKVTPRSLGRASTYYIRIASTDNSTQTLNTVLNNTAQSYALDLNKARDLGNLPGQPFRLPQEGNSQAQRSAWSQAFKATIPNANTGAFMDAVSAALLVMILSRSDVPLIDEVEGWPEEAIELAKEHKKMIPGVALLGTGLEPYTGILNRMFPGGFQKYMEAKGKNPQAFRQDLAVRCRTFAKDLCDKVGARPELHEFIAQNTIELRDAKFRDVLTSSNVSTDIWDSEAERHDGDPGGFTLLDLLEGEKKTTRDEADDQVLRELTRQGEEEDVEDDIRITFPDLVERTLYPGAWRGIGIAPNIYSMEIPETLVGAALEKDGIIQGRKNDFIELIPSEVADWEVVGQVPAAKALEVLSSSPASLRMFYEKYVQEDGSILVPTKVLSYMRALQGQERKAGSGDFAPVYYWGAPQLRAGLQAKAYPPQFEKYYGARFLRTMFREYESGILYSQSALVLGIAAAAGLRAPQDGEWIAFRFLDSFPALDDFFESIQQWLDALAEALKSVTDAIIEYIEFVEDRIIELQQLIRRINSLIQSILGFTVGIPQCSALLLTGQGTDGITQKFITAENKPSDSPLAYGGGVAILAGGVPSFLVELLQLIPGQDSDPNQGLSVTQPTPMFGLENLEAPNNPPPDDEPDVL